MLPPRSDSSCQLASRGQSLSSAGREGSGYYIGGCNEIGMITLSDMKGVFDGVHM